MLEIWVTADFLKSILNEYELEVENQDELLKYTPPILCADADIYETSNGEGFFVDYNSELIRFEEDEENDFYE